MIYSSFSNVCHIFIYYLYYINFYIDNYVVTVYIVPFFKKLSSTIKLYVSLFGYYSSTNPI